MTVMEKASHSRLCYCLLQYILIPWLQVCCCNRFFFFTQEELSPLKAIIDSRAKKHHINRCLLYPLSILHMVRAVYTRVCVDVTVFKPVCLQVLLCFSRDTAVLDHFKYNSATPPKSFIQGKGGDEECAVVYPPNGVIPFHGFSMYVAPLCFLYNEPSKLYSVFREMYVRYFFRLHSISSSPSGIVSLCLQFERLLQTYLPQLFYHLRQIGAQPLRIAFKWMVRAFSGYLSTDQLLLLWDRILGYDSLEVVAVLAAAVFAFRAENLMEVTSLASAEVCPSHIRLVYVCVFEISPCPPHTPGWP
ncbi:TBC1 domain family member 19-like [Plectropomus leopardus]|uniref:TBC1 domain family member 19-like n=1 Tax=Plectropomus leopardus TaxID=160734 RepID=UPI001C4AF35C|nr:TBC1 domain family member 19-like [Plectropomus leopardus]